MRKNQIQILDILRDNYSQPHSKWNGIRYNKTARFCLPMVDLNISGKALVRYLKNVYLDDQELEHDIERPLFLLFSVKSESDKLWKDFIDIITTNKNYKELYVMDYYVGRSNLSDLIMYVLQVPEKWSHDFELFKKGRYSLFSDAYKSKFPRYLQLSTGEKTENFEWGIINKSTFRKDTVAREFINPPTTTAEEAFRFRRSMDSWPEVWARPEDKDEIYHYKPFISAETRTVEPNLREVSSNRTDS